LDVFYVNCNISVKTKFGINIITIGILWYYVENTITGEGCVFECLFAKSIINSIGMAGKLC